MKRDGSEVLSPPKPPRAVHNRMSQFDTQTDPPALERRLSQADTVAALTPDDPDTSRTLTPVQASLLGDQLPRRLASSLRLATSCRGSAISSQPDCPLQSRHSAAAGPSAGSGPAASVLVVNSDIFARARMAAVQSRVAAPVVCGPRAPPTTSSSSVFHDGSHWCSKCPRWGSRVPRGFSVVDRRGHAGSAHSLPSAR